jgi:hypothetical protein rflaF_11934
MSKYMDIKIPHMYNWIINSDGFFCKQVIEQMIKDGMPQEATEEIIQNGVRILSQCPNPALKINGTKTGIIIGKVQSGKTSNFISTLSLAFDNGYNLAIVLGGNKKNLTKQNSIRIQQAFNMPADKLVVLTTEANSTLITTEHINDFLLNGRKVIIVGLKHPKHINDIANIFEDTLLSEVPTIIIDDEGDQATLNTQVYKNSMSSTYESVIRLKTCINTNCFLSVTATPQANILIETCDMLSPDFGELVYPGHNYCGLLEFHGQDQNIFCKVIPETESASIVSPIGIPESLHKAFGDFFIGGAIRKYRGDNNPHSMLIHPSQTVSIQKVVQQKIDTLLDQWKEKARMKLNGVNDIAYSSLKKILFDAYERFYNDGVKVPAFKDIELLCLKTIVDCSPILLCNSSENASENAKYWSTNIYVGGNMVERGITLKGLAVTYITRRARGNSNVDNTEQRARWFGYKKDFLDVCRVWMPNQIKQDFSVILEHDDDLWATIIRSQNAGLEFKQIPRIFKLSSSVLQLTRRNVARSVRMNMSEWKAQQYFLLDSQQAIKNSELIDSIKKLQPQKVVDKQYNGDNLHRFVPNINYHWLFENILSKLHYNKNEPLNLTFFMAINEVLHNADNIRPAIDLLWVRDIKHETRALSEDNSVKQLFQGRNPNLDSATFYPGDRSMVDDRIDCMQLQIHYVKPTNRENINHYCPMIALYIPQRYAEIFSQYVTRAGGKL